MHVDNRIELLQLIKEIDTCGADLQRYTFQLTVDVAMQSLQSMALYSVPTGMPDYSKDIGHGGTSHGLALAVATSYTNSNKSNFEERTAVMTMLERAYNTVRTTSVANMTTAEPLGRGNTDTRPHIAALAGRMSDNLEALGNMIISAPNSMTRLVGQGVRKVGTEERTSVVLGLETTMSTTSELDDSGFQSLPLARRTYDSATLGVNAAFLAYINRLVNVAEVYISQLELERLEWETANPDTPYVVADHIQNARAIIMSSLNTEMYVKLTKLLFSGTEVVAMATTQMLSDIKNIEGLEEGTMTHRPKMAQEDIVVLHDLYPHLYDTDLGAVPVMNLVKADSKYIATFDTTEQGLENFTCDESLDTEQTAFMAQDAVRRLVEPCISLTCKTTHEQIATMYANREVMGKFSETVTTASSRKH